MTLETTMEIATNRNVEMDIPWLSRIEGEVISRTRHVTVQVIGLAHNNMTKATRKLLQGTNPVRISAEYIHNIFFC